MTTAGIALSADGCSRTRPSGACIAALRRLITLPDPRATIRPSVVKKFEGLCDFDFFAKLYEHTVHKGASSLSFYEFRSLIEDRMWLVSKRESFR